MFNLSWNVKVYELSLKSSPVCSPPARLKVTQGGDLHHYCILQAPTKYQNNNLKIIFEQTEKQ